MKKLLYVGLLGMVAMSNASSKMYLEDGSDFDIPSDDYVSYQHLPSTGKLVSASSMTGEIGKQVGDYFSSRANDAKQGWSEFQDYPGDVKASYLGAAGVFGLATLYGITTLFKSAGASEQQAEDMSLQLVQACAELGVDPMASWDEIEKTYKNDVSTGLTAKAIQDSYNYLKSLHQRQQLPSDLKVFQEWAAEAFDVVGEGQNQSAKQYGPVYGPVHRKDLIQKAKQRLVAIEAAAAGSSRSEQYGQNSGSSQMRPPVIAPASPQTQAQLKTQMLGMVSAIEALRSMVHG